jgi:hypothetical protein
MQQKKPPPDHSREGQWGQESTQVGHHPYGGTWELPYPLSTLPQGGYLRSR